MNALTEQIFESLFNQITTPISVIKANPPEFTIAALNDQYRKNSGTPPGEIIGKPAFDVYKPWDEASSKQFELLKSGLQQAITEKNVVNLPVLMFESPAEDGKTVNQTWWQIEINPILSAGNKVEYLMCNTLNVTDQELTRRSVGRAKQKEDQLHKELREVNGELMAINEKLTATVEELRLSQASLEQLNGELETRVASRTQILAENEKRSRSILDALPQIAWTSTLNGEVDFYNRRWYDYTGLDLDTTSWQQVIHPDDLQYNLDKYSAILQSDKPGEFEIREKGKDGIYRWHLVRIQPLFGESGEIEHWIGTATDIDALKKLQQQKDDFISIASHELKTPITALKASLQLLDKMKDNLSAEMLPKLIMQSRKSMQKISTLVDDLLNLGRLQQRNLQLNKTTFTISEMLNASCNPISVAGKHIFYISGDKELQVHADEHRIEQVIVNLVNNAVKYAPDSNEIVFFIQQINDMAKISVKDNGPGIPNDKLPHLFDRYYKVDHAEHPGSGLGLGLYISSEIVKRHSGEMGVESELGKGSTFWFTLPVNG
ncbi:MAG: domain S-box protein [Mucilaginibacter sp.]|nr:domain S-box protein [Mucilaginibacter sp.]